MAMCYRGNKEATSYHIVRFIENLMTDKKQVVDLFCGGCSVACALPKRFHVVANVYVSRLEKRYVARHTHPSRC